MSNGKKLILHVKNIIYFYNRFYYYYHDKSSIECFLERRKVDVYVLKLIRKISHYAPCITLI